MRILAVSDEEEPWLTSRSCRERLGDIDLVVSCGDLPARYLEHIETLLNVPLAYVWGNHDAGYLEHPPQGCVSIEGRLCDFRGLRIMGLGGSMRYSDRSFGFTEQQMRLRIGKLALLARATGGLDLLVTHAPARGYGDLEDLPHRGFESFSYYMDKLRPLYMLHGHVHLNYGRIARARTHPCGTRIVNAFGSQVIEIPDGDLREREPFLVPSIG